jgi:hypothetical protein
VGTVAECIFVGDAIEDEKTKFNKRVDAKEAVEEKQKYT